MSRRFGNSHNSYPFKNAFAFRASHCRVGSLGASASGGDVANSGINGHRTNSGTE
jgi:hypothetical protein